MALLYLGSACMQDPEAPHNQPDTPTLSVDETSVTRVSMLVNGSFGHDLTDITSYGVELSTTLFESGGEVQTLTPQEVGPDGYALGISGLSPNETYYLRAFISNGHSKMYSSVITQKTPETSVASVSDVTLSADGTYMTATLEDNGGRSVEEVGFVWGEQNDRRAIRREKRYPATIGQDGRFSLPLSLLGPGTHYLLAYAEDNKESTGFSLIPFALMVDEPIPEPPTPGISPSKYLTFTSEGTTTISLKSNGSNKPVLYYSHNATDWDEWDYTELTFTADNPLYLCGDNPDGFSKDIGTGYNYFVANGSQFSITGDIMSLLNKDEDMHAIPCAYCFQHLFGGIYGLTAGPSLPATTLTEGCYDSMYYGCTGLVSAPALPAEILANDCYARMFYECSRLKTAPDLPATTLARSCYYQMFYKCSSLETAPSLSASTLSAYCYQYMFSGCTSLRRAPALPATSLAINCYESMFMGCSSLTDAPELPATTLYERCYAEMFAYCTNLSSAPELPAESLAVACYELMFIDCSKINHIKCLAKNTSHNGGSCTTSWLSGVADQGTFVKAAEMNDWTTGGSGIPEGWTVLNEDGTAPIAPSKYLTFTSEGTTKLSLSNQGYAPVLYYSFDTTSWTQWDYGELSFAADKPLYICGDNANGLCPDSNVYTVNVFTASGDLFAVSGDIMSLLNKDEDMTAIPGHPGSSAISSCFYGLFRDCTILTSGPSLPASQLTPLCYSYMFSGCTALKVAPELPATIISSRCYDHMFEGCSALTEAPALSANSLAPGCYANMFQDCTGLSSAPELPATTLTGYCYDNMFQGCTRLTAVPVLPATAIDMYSYRGMFSGCTSLVTPPELPATSFKSFECYEEMFKGCTSLATAPALPVTELTNGCYANMFKDCTSLRTAPELPAEVLVRNCYYGMFENCSKLNYVKCLVKEVNDSANLNRWLYGVASSGTFVKSAQASNWPAGSSGIPEGWAVVNDGDTPSGGNEGTGEEDWN